MMHISSATNPKIKEIVRLGKSPAARRDAGLFVCEGPVLLAEALAAGLAPAQVFALQGEEDALPPLPPGVACTVSRPVLEKLCATVTPRGPVFTLPIAAGGLPAADAPILALDCLRDPGNMGTIIRTAEALGVAVVLLGECADPYSPKVVRAAMGSLFRHPPLSMDYSALADLCGGRGMPLYAAALDESSLPVGDVALGGACFVVGNEARGITPQGLDICQKKIIIPIRGAQSLNAAVAAAILMWEACR